jgi:hypothetical protein
MDGFGLLGGTRWLLWSNSQLKAGIAVIFAEFEGLEEEKMC